MIAAQGDLLIVPNPDEFPSNAEPVKPASDGSYVIAPSANGHPHVLVGKIKSVTRLMGNVETFYVEAEDAALVHHGVGEERHAPITVVGRVRIKRQREMTPDGWAQVVD